MRFGHFNPLENDLPHGFIIDRRLEWCNGRTPVSQSSEHQTLKVEAKGLSSAHAI